MPGAGWRSSPGRSRYSRQVPGRDRVVIVGRVEGVVRGVDLDAVRAVLSPGSVPWVVQPNWSVALHVFASNRPAFNVEIGGDVDRRVAWSTSMSSGEPTTSTVGGAVLGQLARSGAWQVAMLIIDTVPPAAIGVPDVDRLVGMVDKNPLWPWPHRDRRRRL